MKRNIKLIIRVLFGSDQISERSKQQQMLRSLVGITGTVCIVYGACSIPKTEDIRNTNAAKETSELVILGKEDEEIITLTAQEIVASDGTIISLKKFLDTKVCGSCARCCLLSGPHCSKGRVKADKQTAYYEQAVELIQSGTYEGLSMYYGNTSKETIIRIGDNYFSVNNFPAPVNGEEVKELHLENETMLETVSLLSKLDVEQYN